MTRFHPGAGVEVAQARATGEANPRRKPPRAATPPRPGEVALRLPFAGANIVAMGRVYVLALFLLPSTALDLVGYDYSVIGGSQLTKIHPVTYFEVALFIAFVASYPRKRDLARYYLAARPGTLFFLAVSVFALVNIIAGKRNGFGMFFDTDLHLALVSLLLPFAPAAEMARLEKFLHGFFFVNALVALFELATGLHPFPLTTYSPDGYSFPEPRATAFLSHPLHAAAITCAYVVSLLCGAGRLPRPWMRDAAIGLQCAALLAFGGRAAFILSVGVILLKLLWSALRFGAGAKLSYGRLLLAAAAPPLVVAGVAAFASLGLFDQFLQRFDEDGGSARTRLLMWPLLMSFNSGDMLWGAPTDLVFSSIVSYGLEWGVENPFIQIAVFQGLVVAVMIMLGVLLLLFENWRSLHPRAAVPMAAFLLLCNGFGSFGGRFIALPIFLVTVVALFRRDGARGIPSPRFAGRGGSPPVLQTNMKRSRKRHG